MLDANFDNDKYYPIKIGERQSSQLIEIKTVLNIKKKTFWGIESKPKGNYILKVIDVDPGNLILNSNDELIKILNNNNGKASSQILISLSDYETPITLLLNPNAVKNYKKRLDHISDKEADTEVSFKLQLSKEDNNKNTILSKKETIKIKIENPTIEPIYSIKFNNNGYIEYDPTCNEKIEIGVLTIKHNKTIECMPELATCFTLSAVCDAKEYTELVSLDMTKIKETHPIIAEGTDITIYGANNSVLRHNTSTIVNQRKQYSLTHIRSGNIANVISIPILFDMTKIQNPVTDVLDLTITINCRYTGMLFGERFERDISYASALHLGKNKLINDLKVEFGNNEETFTYIKNNKTYKWGRIILSNGFINSLTLKIQNTATAIDSNHKDACIIVANVNQELITPDKDRIIFTDNTINAEDYFKFNTQEKGKYHKLYPTQHIDSTKIIYDLLIRASDIKEIKKSGTGSYTTSFKIQIGLDYAICLSGDENDRELSWDHFTTCVEWTLEQAANPEWLSIDFGTSAIVAAYTANVYDINQQHLLNLDRNKAELHKRTYTDSPRRNDIRQEPPHFIPSTISFNSNNRGDYATERADTDYKNFPLWLSPSTGMQEIMLPCLKTLIGYKTIPNIFTDVERNFKYQIENNGILEDVQLFDQNGNIIERGLSLVNTILEEVYKQLFRYFICLESYDPQNPNPVRRDSLHKLVLSVPNTFTPVQHALLKKIAQNYFPNLRPEYLQVVSESDTVACYYLANWNQLFAKVDKKVVTRLEEKENVLVYDMGAGTLDLTYFEKIKSIDSVTLHIKGRLGMNKAGNYLDYLIAEILSEFLDNEESKKKYVKLLVLNKNERINNMTPKKDCEELKSFIKNTIKPLLNTPEETIPAYKSYEFGKHTIKDILNHNKYSQFIEECTTDVLENIINSFRKNEGMLSYHNAEKDIFPIDVVVFSGRSTALKGIRESISKYISDKYDNVLCADLTTNTVSPIKELTDIDKTTTENLKTVVTYGSLIYADLVNRRSRYRFSAERIYASYGFLAWNVPYHKWEWYQLISPSSQQANQNTALQIENYQRLIFVQTYSHEPAIDWGNGNKDLIMPIVSFTIPTGSDGIRRISMAIDDNNTIRCFIEGVGQIRLEPHDDFDNINLRKSLWPVVF